MTADCCCFDKYSEHTGIDIIVPAVSALFH